MPCDAKDADAILACLLKMDAGKIGDDIRRDVLMRIAHFVEQLLLDRLNAYATAGAFMLGDNKSAVRRSLDDRKADIRHIGNVRPIVLTVTARGLCTAFNDVTGDRAGRDA